MSNYSFCPAWPDELKAKWYASYRAHCRHVNLEKRMEKGLVDPEDFDDAMNDLEAALRESIRAGVDFHAAQRAWCVARDFNQS